MKVVIIGGGNMGSSVTKGLVQGNIFKAKDITVIDVNQAVLDTLKDYNSDIQTVSGNYDPVGFADIVLLAVKPWLIKDIILDIKFKMNYEKQILVSIAAGISIDEMSQSLLKHSDGHQLPAIFRAIPNTAIAVKQSVTLISTNNANSEQKALILSIFEELGTALFLDEDKMAAGTALTSCGIAYLFRYVRAAMLAGTELGFYPEQAQKMIVNTMLGAAELLNETKNNPEVEIDKVTTPGGITIKGINELEANGFTNAIVKAIKASK